MTQKAIINNNGKIELVDLTPEEDIALQEERSSKAVIKGIQQKQELLNRIKPLQQNVMSKNSDVYAIKFQDSENDDDLTNEKKKANKDFNKKVIKWRKEMRLQNNNITIYNTTEEIQSRIDRINELDSLFPEIE